MKAVILAGGKGTRLMPLTKDIPKPMVPIAGKPLLEWQILLLKKYGIKDIILCTNYLHQVIENYFQDGKKWDLNIQYSLEKEELGTAGAVKLAEQLIGNDDFFVIFGDEIFSINLLQMARHHTKHNAEATVLVHEANHPLDSDLVEITNENKITRIFRAKEGDSFRPINLSCLYVMKASILKKYSLAFSDFGKQIFPKLIREGTHVQAYITEEYIRDVGTLERLKKVEDDLKAGYIFGLPNKEGNYL
ncbi:MAG: nucleotidyltransferase family protein [Nanoarchaeota archaeon]